MPFILANVFSTVLWFKDTIRMLIFYSFKEKVLFLAEKNCDDFAFLLLFFFVSVVCFTSYWHLIANKISLEYIMGQKIGSKNEFSLVIATFKIGQNFVSILKTSLLWKNYMQNPTYKMSTCSRRNLCTLVKMLNM